MKLAMPRLRILLIVLGLMCAPALAQAQFRVVADERGKLVFVNDLPAAQPKQDKSRMRSNATAPAIPAPAAASKEPAAASSPRPTTPQELDRIVEKTAEKHRVDSRLVRAVIYAESNWNATAVSSKGARGLMQLHPATAQQLGVADSFDPAQNVDGGVRYLSMMLDRYKGDMTKALAAYNAGPGAVDRSGGVPRIAETRSYVQKVTSAYMGGTGLRPRTVAAPMQIYRVVEADGRVVFRNE